MGNSGLFLEVDVCLGKKSKYFIYVTFVQGGGQVSPVSVPYHELLDDSLTIWFVVTECDFSLLYYRTFWWVMKGFVLEATSRHAYLTWSLPIVTAAQFSCSSPAGECQASLPVCLCQNADISRAVHLCCFFGCIWPVITLVLMRFVFFVGPKEEKH